MQHFLGQSENGALAQGWSDVILCPTMLKLAALGAISAALVMAQTPDIRGVWKADLGKSKLAGPPGSTPKNYLAIIERKTALFDSHTKEEAPQFVETTGIWGEHGGAWYGRGGQHRIRFGKTAGAGADGLRTI